MLNIIKKYGVTLAIFASALTGLTSLVNEWTKSIINKKILRQKQTLFNYVIPKKFYDNDLQKSCYIVESPHLGKGKHHLYIAYRNKLPVGVVMEATAPDGYSGAIHLLIGSDFFGKILGVYVTEHHETPNLGDQIELRKSNWILNFIDKTINEKNKRIFAIKKDGGEFDQFTGATITPRAVVNAVKRAGLYTQILSKQLSILSVCKK